MSKTGGDFELGVPLRGWKARECVCKLCSLLRVNWLEAEEGGSSYAAKRGRDAPRHNGQL